MKIISLIHFSISTLSILSSDVLADRPVLGDFAVKTIVNRGTFGAKVFRVYERYSASQFRGIVSYKTDKLPQEDQDKQLKSVEGEFFIDSSSDFAVSYARGGGQCTQFVPDELFKTLELEAIQENLVEVPRYLIGPAKWLFYVKSKRDSLKLLSNMGQKIRNVPSVAFRMSFDRAANSSIVLEVFFAERDLAAGSQDAFPILIDFHFKNTRIASLEFFAAEVQKEQPQQIGSSEVLLDPFRFDHSTSCAELLQKSSSVPSLEFENLKLHQEARFSFKAELNHIGALMVQLGYKAFVAYDSSLGMLRIDRNWPERVVSSKQVVDFRTNLQYYLISENLKSLEGTTKYCTTSAIWPASSAASMQPKTMELLLGTMRAKYLGKARVRGSQASTYLALDESLPFWIEQPISYGIKDSWHQLIWDPTKEIAAALDSANASSERVRLQAVVYVADTNPMIPLLVEIFRVDNSLQVTHDKFTINFYDFIWDLEYRAPNGDSPLELFTLANICNLESLENGASGGDGQAELLLEIQPTGENKAEQRLAKLSFTELNLLLIASLKKELGLVVATMSDFETNWATRKSEEKKQLVLRLKYQHSTNTMVSMIKVGKGRQIGGLSNKLMVNTLFHCLMLAASKQEQVYFAYHVLKKFCFIGTIMLRTKDDLQQQGEFKQVPFNLDPDGDLDVFSIDRHDSHTGQLDGRWLAELKFSTGTQLDKAKRTLQLELNDGKPALEFRLVRYAEPNGENVVTHESHYFEAKTKIDHVGLVEQLGVSKLIQCDNLMQCRAACYAKPQCRSYSYCVRELRVECVLSTIGFDSEQKMEKIHQAADNVATGKLFQVEIDDTNFKVKLVKKITCTTYHKRYQDYFTHFNEKVTPKRDIPDTFMIPVNSPEQCATYCVQYNLRKYSSLSERISKSLDAIEEAISRNDYTQSKEALDTFNSFRNSREPLNFFCSSYIYIRWTDISAALAEGDAEKLFKLSLESIEETKKLEPFVEELLPKMDRNMLETLHMTDYCSVLVASSIIKSNRSILSMLMIDSLAVQMSRIKSIYFYEETYGVSLREAIMEESQRIAFKKLDTNYFQDLDTLNLASKAAKEANNRRIGVKLSRSQCARACISQALGPRPACKSFDFVVETDPQNSDRYRSMCYLNTITLAEALLHNRSDLIDRTTNSHEFEHWHYEPHADLGVADMSTLNGEQLIIDSMHYRTRQEGHRLVWLMIITVFGIVSGIYCGTYLGNNYITSKSCSSDRRASTSSKAPVISLPMRTVLAT